MPRTTRRRTAAATSVVLAAGLALTAGLAATLAAPSLPAMLVATDMGRPVYERMGYAVLDRWTFLMRDRA